MIVNQAMVYDHMNDVDLRGKVTEVHKSRYGTSYMVTLIDHNNIETISYATNMRLDPLQALANL